MTEIELKLIKMDTSHYYQKTRDSPVQINHNGRIFFDRFKRVDSLLGLNIIKKHIKNEITVAHSIINSRNKVENIVIDYNGTNDDTFYHKAQLLLRDEGYLNFTAYRSKTKGHLHIYIHKGHTDLSEAKLIAKTLNLKLSSVAPKQWRIFPTDELPPSFNILVLPYSVYAKERGMSWLKHM